VSPSPSFSASAPEQFEQRVNFYASVRDRLMPFTSTLVVGTSNTIKLQAAALVRITQATHQLTRASAVSFSPRHSLTRLSLIANTHTHTLDAGIGQMPSIGHRSLRHGHEHRLRRRATGGQPDRPVCLECVDRERSTSLLDGFPSLISGHQCTAAATNTRSRSRLHSRQRLSRRLRDRRRARMVESK
jgi:hypothetical protein